MPERSPQPLPEEHFADYQASRFLQFGNDIQLEGDPQTPNDFARAFNYLETITQHCMEFGPWWEKTGADIVYELDYHNAWHQHEIEQERKVGEKTAEYREIKIANLRALSKRRVLAFEDTGWEVTFAYRIVCFFDKLIGEAASVEAKNQNMMLQSEGDSSESLGQPLDPTLAADN